MSGKLNGWVDELMVGWKENGWLSSRLDGWKNI